MCGSVDFKGSLQMFALTPQLEVLLSNQPPAVCALDHGGDG